VSLAKRPGPRFVVEAGAIVAAATIAGVEHLAWWEIGGCVLVVLAAAIVLEARLSEALPPPAQAPPVVELSAELQPAHVRVIHAAAPKPQPEPQLEPVPALSSTGPWNVGELARVLAERGDVDEERAFLLHYLRDYAAPDGTLPPEFDDLVRESFRDLLGVPA
jgi:hypothetical protein